MTLTVHTDLLQRSDEWYAARCGIVTASAVGQLLTVGPPDAITLACPTCNMGPGEPCVSVAKKAATELKSLHDTRNTAAASRPPTVRVAHNDYARALTATLVAEQITGHVEPTYESEDMLRGQFDEPIARDVYSGHYAEAVECGFMVLEESWGRLGYSPDGTVGDDGLIEVKSRRQKKQLTTILTDAVPGENMAQLQAGLLVSGRKWIDYVSYCGGMPLYTKRVYPDPQWQEAIVAVVQSFETNAANMIAAYHIETEGLPMTERTDDVGLVF